MEKGKRICKVCGAEYPYCKTFTPHNKSRWQDVACCIEHAEEYFEQVAIARGEKKVEEKVAQAAEVTTKPASKKKKAAE